MYQGRIARKVALMVLFSLALQVADPQTVKGAPPFHANRDKERNEKDNTGGRRRGQTSNKAPTISGTPSTSVLQDTIYRFSPIASDADDDVLTFSVVNLPRWATFDAVGGELTGKPSAADVGTYTDIFIAVSDGQETAQLLPFSMSVEAYGLGSATLSWLPPSENSDGSQLLDLAGYHIYWGQESSNYTDSVEIMNPGITTSIIENLLGGTYYFAATAINTGGIESEFSAEVSKTLSLCSHLSCRPF